MRPQFLLVVLLVVGILVAAGSAVAKRQGVASTAAAGCADYVVIDSRGSGEPGGLSAPGRVFYPTFRKLVLQRDPAAKVSVVPNGYPAWGSIPTMVSALAKLPQQYHKSVVAGKKWLSNQIGTLLTSCPDSKLVLTGYSQGAQVTGDVFQNVDAKQIVAVVLFGDPKFNSADPAARGGKSGLDGALGTRPLFATAPGKQSSGHVLSYCHDKDPVCQGVSRLRHGPTYHAYGSTDEPEEAAYSLARFVAMAATPVYISPVWGGGGNLVRPKTLDVGSAGLHGSVSGLWWRDWGSGRATAVGVGNICVTMGTCHNVGRVDVVASALSPVVDCGLDRPSPGRVYRRVTASYRFAGELVAAVVAVREACGVP